MYLLDTSDLYFPFENLGTLGPFKIPLTFRYLLDTLNLHLPFGFLDTLHTFWIPWTFRYLLIPWKFKYLFDILVPLGPLGTSRTISYLLNL